MIVFIWIIEKYVSHAGGIFLLVHIPAIVSSRRIKRCYPRALAAWRAATRRVATSHGRRFIRIVESGASNTQYSDGALGPFDSFLCRLFERLSPATDGQAFGGGGKSQANARVAAGSGALAPLATSSRMRPSAISTMRSVRWAMRRSWVMMTKAVRSWSLMSRSK